MAEQPEHKPNEAPNEKPNGDGAGAGDLPPKPEETPKFTQAQLDAIVKDRLERERKATEAREAKAKEDADAARLKEQGEFQKLAEQAQARVKELEAVQTEIDTVKADAERYKAALTTYLETQIKDLPAYVLEAIEDKDPIGKLAYLSKHGEALRTKNGSGIPATPKPGDRKALTEEQQRAADRQAAQQVKSRF